MFNQQFYPGYMPNYNPYSIQPIQQIQTPQQQMSYVQAKSPSDMVKLRAMPNLSYIGINEDDKEIYIRKMNNDGNVESETYVLKSEEKEKSQFDNISERLAAIENTLKERKHEQFNGYVNQQPSQQQAQFNTSNGYLQSNDER